MEKAADYIRCIDVENSHRHNASMTVNTDIINTSC